MKKRFLALSLALLMTLSLLTGCGGKTPAPETKTDQPGGADPVDTLKLTYATAEQANMAARLPIGLSNRLRPEAKGVLTSTMWASPSWAPIRT